MKFILIAILVFNSLLLAVDKDMERKIRTEKQIQKVIEDEKKYAKEQVFYSEENYDFNSSKVNEDSLHVIEVPEVEDLDMDDVYD